jgi:non-specific protein-tyrosine kinase
VPQDLALEIEAHAADPEAARVLSLAVGDEMRERSAELVVTDEVRQAEQAIAANERAIAFSRNRLNTLIAKPEKTRRDRDDIQGLFAQISVLQAEILRYQPNARSFVGNRLQWFERPSAPESPAEPRPVFWTLLALVVGGMLFAGIGFAIEFIRDKVRDQRDLEAATGFEVLGSISERRGDIRRGAAERLVVLRHPSSSESDAYRSLRARTSLASDSARTLLVASVDDSDSGSSVAANLALAFAEAGSTVILVDADHRFPSLHAFFGVPNDRGLSTLLRDGDAPLEHVTMPTQHPRLRVLPAGPSSSQSSELLGSPQVPRLFGRLLQVADMVICDSPSMAWNLDAAMLARHLQASILVVPSGARGRSAGEAARLLDASDARFAGTVLYRTARGSHPRTAARQATILPSPHVATLGPRATAPTGLTANATPSPAATAQPSRPEGASTSPSTYAPTYLLEAFLYRIIPGRHARTVTKQETSPAAGAVGSAGVAKGLPAGPHVASPSTPKLPARGAPAEPWPEHPRPAIAVPVEPRLPVATQPYVGPYAGGFKVGPDG